MFRRFLCLSVRALALLVVLGAPGQLHAQHMMRGGFPHGMHSGFRGEFRPGFHGEFDHRFHGGFDHRFRPGFFEPRFHHGPGPMRFFDPRFSRGGFGPFFPPIIGPRFFPPI
jgi:hypothetical protein